MATNMNVNYRRYPEEYFAGADVSIYIGDTWIDEVSSLNAQLTEMVMPIFGYASRTIDAVARGQRLVSGSFEVNFKSSNYLFDAIDDYILKGISGEIKVGSKIDPHTNIYTPVGTQLGIEEILSKPEADREFDRIASAYEERFWGPVDDPFVEEVGFDEAFFQSTYDLEGLSSQQIERANEIQERGFDIVIRFGDGKLQPGVINRGEVRKITGVQLISFATEVSLGGEPVREVYQYLARDIARG